MEGLKQESFQFGGLKHDSFRNSISFKSVNEGTSPFPWDDVIADNQVSNNNISNVVPGIWNKTYDPSFCSGKFSARSTSFGGEYNTRDENFSDFGTIPSFQVFLILFVFVIHQSSFCRVSFVPLVMAIQILSLVVELFKILIWRVS